MQVNCTFFQWQQKNDLEKLQSEDQLQRDQVERKQQNDEDSSDLKQVIASL